MSGLRKLGERIIDKGYSQRAENSLGEANEERRKGFDEGINTYKGVRDEYKPYMELGKTSASALQTLFGDPQGYLNDPSYKARLKTSLDAVETSAAAKGKLFGGQTLIELMKVGGEFASAELDRATQRYMGGVNAGIAGTQGYDSASNTLSDLYVGRGMGEAKYREDKALIDLQRSKYASEMFSSWFSGSGPFGQATGKKAGGG